MIFVIMINRSLAFVSHDLELTVGNNWTSYRDSLNTFYRPNTVFIDLFDCSVIKRLVEKVSKTVFGQYKVVLSLQDVQFCPIINYKSWEMKLLWFIVIVMTNFMWIYFSTALYLSTNLHICVQISRFIFQSAMNI